MTDQEEIRNEIRKRATDMWITLCELLANQENTDFDYKIINKNTNEIVASGRTGKKLVTEKEKKLA